jgi:copper chaperone CopZ
MTRKTTTVMLENAACGGGSTHTVERALLRVPGVSRAYVNPATEAAYVEYDADRCDEDALTGAVESVGVRVLRPTAARPAVAPSSSLSERLPMRNDTIQSRSWWAFGGFIAIAGFFLFTEHRAHLFGILPFLFLLACPFLHMFGHGGHAGHGGHDGRRSRAEDGDGHSHSARVGDYGKPSPRQLHEHPASSSDPRRLEELK